ncbi:adenine-specific DNA-methyltransferase [Maribacter spongiicola]|uniref:site-specific DNA-methyltransferase (adenine-specific) n=1 Tax=Maribacter spongiicola TaxID=1206753 RepID=A0A4R7JYP3_9FLAO|nr:site-specific DNA-methyltransferase [Maribacter spongiicola]TDT43640.1 adenine-specific DNA-methyltransferase [Maribacter spongiicola]
MDGNSQTPQEQKLNALREVLPEAFAEGKIDWEKLKAALGEDINFTNERYVLNWAGKSEAFKVLQAPTTSTLVPAKDESINFNETKNIFIEGENLEVLKVLQKSYFGKVKMIYIDPPYNTGNDSFIYPDKFSETKEEYEKRVGDKDEEGYMTKDGMFKKNSKENGQYHSNWLNMMYPRLFLAKNLLRQDGAIFISIDYNEMDNLVHVIKEVFGEENLLAVIANVNNPKGRSDDAYFATSHEYLIVAAKNINEVAISGFEPEEKITKRYNKVDVNGKKYREIDLRKTGDADLREDREDMFYYFYHNEKTNELKVFKDRQNLQEWREIVPLREDGKEGRYRWGFNTAKRDISQLFARYMPNRKIWGVFEMDYLEGRKPVKSTTSWTFKDVNSERGTEQFMDLGFEKEVYPKPKPIGTLKRAVQLTHTDDKKYIALDFFAGSGSFGHAAYEFICEKEKEIQFILIQLPELLEENKKEHKAAISLLKSLKRPLNYAEISKERLTRASEKYRKKFPDFKGDLGFKVLKLADSNFKQWQQIKGKDAKALEAQMKLFVDPVSKNATVENMVYELLLKSGKDLNSKIEHKENYYSINNNELIFILEKADKKIVDAVLKEQPQKVIALDKLFKNNDQLKTNTVLQMKDSGIEFKTI